MSSFAGDRLPTLDWMLGRAFQELASREHDWTFQFDGSSVLVVECLWRLMENDVIRCTSSDHGHKFGLPAPVDAVREINSQLANAHITGIDLRAGTLDLCLLFDTGHRLEIIPDSSGYEAWNVIGNQQQFIATGGGRLFVLPS